MIGHLNAQEIENLLHHQVIGRIGCCVDNRCYVVPISFAYDGRYIYCRSQEGLKIQMMRKNPRVCFETENTRNHANWQSVVVQGIYEELEDVDARKDALTWLHKRVLPIRSSETTHLGNDWPFGTENNDAVDGIIFRIQVMEKSGRFERTSQDYYFAS